MTYQALNATIDVAHAFVVAVSVQTMIFPVREVMKLSSLLENL